MSLLEQSENRVSEKLVELWQVAVGDELCIAGDWSLSGHRGMGVGGATAINLSAIDHPSSHRDQCHTIPALHYQP